MQQWNAQQGDVAAGGSESSWIDPLVEFAKTASLHVQVAFQAGTLWTKLRAWNLALSAIFDFRLTAQRTALNWVARGMELQGTVPQSGATQIHANWVATYVWETLEGAYYAGNDGRISANQVVAVGAAFKTVWM